MQTRAAISKDPDQMKKQYDLGLHCLPDLSDWILGIIMALLKYHTLSAMDFAENRSAERKTDFDLAAGKGNSDFSLLPSLWNLFWGVLSLADNRIAPWMAVSRLPRQRSRSDTQPHFKSTRSKVYAGRIWTLYLKRFSTWNSMKMGQLRFKICFTWNLEEMR